MRHRRPVLIAIASLLAASVAAVDEPPPPVPVYYFDRMPFFGNPGTPEEGFILRIVRLVFDEAEIPFQFVKAPVARIFDNMTHPGLHCLAGVFKTPEREQLYKFSADSIYQDEPPHYVIRRRDMDRFRSVSVIADLMTGLHILGAVESYSYGSWVDGNLAAFNPPRRIVNVGDDQSNFFRMLQVGRFDYLFSGLEEALWNLRSYPAYRDSLAVMPLADAPAGNIRWIMYSRDTPDEFIQRLDSALTRVKEGQDYRLLVEAAKR